MTSLVFFLSSSSYFLLKYFVLEVCYFLKNFLKFLVSMAISLSSSLESSSFSFSLSFYEAFSVMLFFFSSFSSCSSPLCFIISLWVRSFPIRTSIERVERSCAFLIEVTWDSQSFLGRILRILLFTSSLEKCFPSFLRVVRRELRQFIISVINHVASFWRVHTHTYEVEPSCF